ncbi:MAG: amidohydrolase family protein [Candidatus Lokiarchaeota archaeon]|nr:amidohydrolase family protein [Candidatus Lokiarchaeota archaeon]
MQHRAIDDAVDHARIIDTHEHFSDTAAINDAGANLFSILPRGYIGFFDFYPGLREDLLKFTRYPQLQEMNYIKLKQFIDSYYEYEFVDVLDMGIQYLHGLSIKHLTEDVFNKLNKSIENAYTEPRRRDRIMKEFHIERSICDVPHNTIGLGPSFTRDFDPIFYKPAMRVNSLLFGFDIDAWNPSTCLIKIMANELKIIPGIPTTFHEFIECVDKILDWSRWKVVSFKCASAYERTINFVTAKEAVNGTKKWNLAKNVFGKSFARSTEQERLAFGDVVMHYMLGRIEGMGIPLQVHTGTAIMPGSNPRNIENLIEAYPAIDFSLLHCGFPWTDETINIIKHHANAHAEMAWLQMLSKEAAAAFLARAIMEGLEHKVIAFGGDCACIEGSTGALLVLKRVVKEAVARCMKQKKVGASDVEQLVDTLFYQNPCHLFFKKEA